MRAVQDLATIFEAEKILDRRIVRLQHRPHRAINNKNARGKGVQKLLVPKILHEKSRRLLPLLYPARAS
jgi:hypothetical protein